MSATALKSESEPDAAAATSNSAFVLHHQHHYQAQQRRSPKCRSNRREKWIGDDSDSKSKRTWDNSSTLTSLKYSSLTVAVLMMGLLCSSSSWVNATDGTGSTSKDTFANSNYDGFSYPPKFDLNDLANLMDMFPEFKEYVVKVLTNYAEQQQRQQQQQGQGLQYSNDNNAWQIPSTTSGPGYQQSIESIVNQYMKGNVADSRTDLIVQQPQQLPKFENENVKSAQDKLGWLGHDYHHHDSYLPQPQHHFKGYHDKGHGWGYDHHKPSGWAPKPDYLHHLFKGYHDKGHGWGYDYKPGWSQPKPDYHHHHFKSLLDKGWGWSAPKPDYHHHHHHEPYKDPHFHYHVGYELGKDVSCVLGLLGFKSWKDFTFHSVFAVLKKLKYIALIGLAFKLGIMLSPLALPLLIPVIIFGAIIKLLPLVLIICLLFKILKAQLKLFFKPGFKDYGGYGGYGGGGWGRENYWKRDDGFMEGTEVSQLWNQIDQVADTVMDSESCVEKVVCKISRKQRQAQNLNQTQPIFADMDLTGGRMLKESGNSFVQFVTGGTQLIQRVMNWFISARKSNEARSLSYEYKDNDSDKIIECEKIPCSIVGI